MLGQEAAETLALQALSWLLADDDRAAMFLAATGAAPGELAKVARDPAFLGAVLDVLLGDESLVIAFCTEAGIPYDRPMAARSALPGGEAVHWT